MLRFGLRGMGPNVLAFLKKHWLAVVLVLGALVLICLEPSRNILVASLAGAAGILSFIERLLGGSKGSGSGSRPSPEKQVDADINVLKAGAVSGARNDQVGLDNNRSGQESNSSGQDRLGSAIGTTDEALNIVAGGQGSKLP